MDFNSEWTFEGGLNEKSRRRREPNPLSIRSVCQYVRKWTFVNLSGTAIMNLYLLPSQAYSLGRFFYTIIAEHPPCIHMIGSFAFGI